MKMNDALLPCPFCGGKATLYFAPTNKAEGIPCFGVSCESCKIMIGTAKEGRTDFFRTPVEAVNAWNERFDMPIKLVAKERENYDY